jgi:hypothetical protein
MNAGATPSPEGGAGKRFSRLPAIFTVLVAAVLAVAVACNGGGDNGQPTGSPSAPVSTLIPTFEARPTLTPGAYEPAPGSVNLFGNPGLEDGTKYWFALNEQTVQTGTVAHSGHASAHLQMRDPSEATGAKVYYLIQELDPAEFPELISGYYRVDNWKRGAAKQYLQFAVIVFDPANLGGQYPNYQMRYPLAGISEEPFKITNAFFRFLGTDDPRQGEWVYFEANIKNDFQQYWTAVPQGYSKIRILFEVRYDDKAPGAAAEADVYYDDLYIGPADANPNKP